jgi:hypothetical protein
MSLAEEQSEIVYFHVNGQSIQVTLTWDTDSSDVITFSVNIDGQKRITYLKMNIDTFKSTYLDTAKDLSISLGGKPFSGKVKSSAGGARRTRKRKMRRSRSRAKSHRHRRH